jgi:hypothetical protein
MTMTATMERPTETIVVPDNRRGVRILPTWEEQHAIDLYAEGHSHRVIEVDTEISVSQQKHLILDRQVPLYDFRTAHPNRPRFLSGTELLVGERAANERMDRIADARLAASEAELAAWQMHRALTT